MSSLYAWSWMQDLCVATFDIACVSGGIKCAWKYIGVCVCV